MGDMPPDARTQTSIVEVMAEALPTHEQGDTTSDISSSMDVITLLVHASMVKSDFLLWSTDANSPKGDPECESLRPRLPNRWNDNMDSRTFVYTRRDDAGKFVAHIKRESGHIDIEGLAIHSPSQIYRFSVNTRDLINRKNLPVRIAFSAQGQELRGQELTGQITSVFTNPDDLNITASAIHLTIVQRLLDTAPPAASSSPDDKPTTRSSLQESASTTAEESAPQPADRDPTSTLLRDDHPYGRNHPRDTLPDLRPSRETLPGGNVPRGDFPPPGFDDELDLNRHHPIPSRDNAPSIGQRDLYPAGLGPHDPMVPHFGGFGGIGGDLGGGMHPTFDDPLFRGGPSGGDGGRFDPQVPPGARFDPLGPGGSPRHGGGRGANAFGDPLLEGQEAPPLSETTFGRFFAGRGGGFGGGGRGGGGFGGGQGFGGGNDFM